MLAKLTKHELKATSRFLVPLYLILLAVSILNRIVLTLDIFDGALSIVRGFVTFAYVVLLIGVTVTTFVLMVMRFYKNLMQDEGYLMFTLPVKSNQLITSKLLISVFWTILSVLGLIVSLLIVFGTPDGMQNFWQGFEEAMDEFRYIFKGNASLMIFEFIVLVFVGISQNILIIYVSIAVGQLFNGHKLLGSFAAYIGINTAMQTFITGILFIGSLLLKKSITELETIPQIIFPVSILFSLILSAAYYFVTDYIFKKKLNLE